MSIRIIEVHERPKIDFFASLFEKLITGKKSKVEIKKIGKNCIMSAWKDGTKYAVDNAYTMKPNSLCGVYKRRAWLKKQLEELNRWEDILNEHLKGRNDCERS